jgi:outer membrane protein TolC
MQARTLVEALAASAERRYKLETISRFDKAQADAELARARVEEEIAVRAYYIASTTLATLLEDDPRRVAESLIFPAGFSAAAEAFPRPKLEDLQQASLAMRPEIAARRIDADIAGLNLRFADNQALRDISLDLQGTRTQSAATYGYASLEDSLRHLGRPDAETTSAALTYVAPWGRRAANAAVSAARANQAAAEINHQAAEAGVILDVNDAVSAYGSALRRVENAQDALKLSEFAYGQVERRFTLGEAVSQVELNRNRRDLLAARLALISARIDVRRAESSLLAAQGTIAERYPAMHPYNDFDRHRLARLAAAGGMRFFGPK